MQQLRLGRRPRIDLTPLTLITFIESTPMPTKVHFGDREAGRRYSRGDIVRIQVVFTGKGDPDVHFVEDIQSIN